MNTQFIIIAGGSGQRLFPLSNSTTPKQFMVMADGKTLLDRTIDRIKLITSNPPLIISNKNHNINKYKNILYEDFSNDTAVAVLRAVLNVKHSHGNCKIVVLPADHHIENEDIFIDDINRGITKVYRNNIVLFGIVPDNPSTKFGYILPNGSEITFKEKPNESEAIRLISNGALWNSGIFASTCDTIIKSIENSTYDITSWIEHPRKGKASSFDVAVLQEYQNISLISGNNWKWSDIGSHDSFIELDEIQKEINDNKTVFKSSCDNVTVLNRGNGKIIVLGLEDIKIIVNGGDILITKNYDYSDELKQMITKNKII
jgi:mannose-1-phosphate guanylyltransferase